MPVTCRSIAQSSRLAILGLGLASCTSARFASPELDQPVFGTTHPTVFFISPAGGPIHARDLAIVATVLRQYKNLDLAERKLVASAVSRRLNALISGELHRLTYEQRSTRDAIWKNPDRSRAVKRLAEYDAALRKAAQGLVMQQLGRLVAVPLKTSDNHSAVAFVRLGTPSVDVKEDASEIDEPLERLVEGNRIRLKSGGVATLIGAPPVKIQLPQP